MAMSKKDFIAIADALKNVNVGKHENPMVHAREDAIVSALCLFMRQTNPRFNEQRWRDYLAGNCGPNGGKLK